MPITVCLPINYLSVNIYVKNNTSIWENLRYRYQYQIYGVIIWYGMYDYDQSQSIHHYATSTISHNVINKKHTCDFLWDFQCTEYYKIYNSYTVIDCTSHDTSAGEISDISRIKNHFSAIRPCNITSQMS